MMLDSLELDETSLTHLDYHWLWGLRYKKTPQPENLGAQVAELLKDEAKLADIIERQKNLYLEHNALVRFFYWSFNINNYTYQAYLLAACKGHQNYLYRSLEKNPSMITNNKLGWGILAPGLLVVLAYAGRRIYHFLADAGEATPAKKASDDVSSNALVRLQDESSEAKLEAMPARADIEAVIVTTSMQPYLVVLGINLNPGDSLKLVDFKSVCKARYLASHPDKPGGTGEEFRRVKEAAESLTKIMYSRVNSSNMHPFEDDPDKYWADFDSCMNEIWANIAKAKASLDATMVLRASIKTDMHTAIAEMDSARIEMDAARMERVANNIEMAASLRVLQEQVNELQRDTPSTSLSTTGAPGLFAPSSARIESQADLSEAEPGAKFL